MSFNHKKNFFGVVVVWTITMHANYDVWTWDTISLQQSQRRSVLCLCVKIIQKIKVAINYEWMKLSISYNQAGASSTTTLFPSISVVKGVSGGPSGPSGPSREGPGVGHKIVSETKQMTKERNRNEWEKGKMCKEKKMEEREREWVNGPNRTQPYGIYDLSFLSKDSFLGHKWQVWPWATMKDVSNEESLA